MSNILRNRLKSIGNQGGVKPIIYLGKVGDFLSIKKKFDTATATVYADITARDAASPSAGDGCYVTAEKKYYYYTGTAWVESNEFTVNDTHTFGASLGFVKLETTDMDERAMEGAGAEENDSTGSEWKLPFKLAGLDATGLQLLKEAPLEQYIALIKDNNGRTFQLGTEDNPAVVRFTGGSTKGKTVQAPGLDFELVSDEQLLFYAGTITTL
jgi:hypothetical protein